MSMNSAHWALLTLVLDWLIRLGLSVRVIMRRRPVGISLAWLTIVMLVPFLGGVVYLMIGELRLVDAAGSRDDCSDWV